ncbi:hypothetical protein PV04_07420 [Phialophora macrospora]|uniref:Uncharacterized protein n=1 Tax=Phialophora macrospora TaxID=1851006 RepID=A0A0D2FAW1_9EURO|nr:hypothetical protein PV04_07420 [Phialophora macrospora]
MPAMAKKLMTERAPIFDEVSIWSTGIDLHHVNTNVHLHLSLSTYMLQDFRGWGVLPPVGSELFVCGVLAIQLMICYTGSGKNSLSKQASLSSFCRWRKKAMSKGPNPGIYLSAKKVTLHIPQRQQDQCSLPAGRVS